MRRTEWRLVETGYATILFPHDELALAAEFLEHFNGL
jgi:hypothetical protein